MNVERLAIPDVLRLTPARHGDARGFLSETYRADRMREAGIDDKEIELLSSPIGLDLGARTPEETAISIAAEIVAGRWGGSGERLGVRDGRIHRDPA